MIPFAVLAFLVGIVLAPDTDLPDHRLPDYIIPLHYQLQIIVNPDNRAFYGKVWIKINCVKATPIIKIHIKGLHITEDGGVKLHKDNENIEIHRTSWGHINDIFIIFLSEKLKQGETYILYIPYKGQLSQFADGFSSGHYEEKPSGNTRWFAYTNINTMARSFFPCFDEPALRATFSLKVGHPKGLRAVSNTFSISKPTGTPQKPSSDISDASNLGFESSPEPLTSPDGEELVWEEFAKTPVLSTYQLALVVSEAYMLHHPVKEHDGTNLDMTKVDQRIWARTEVLQKLSTIDCPLCKIILPIGEFLWNYFDQEIPLPKLDVVILPHALYSGQFGIIQAWEDMFLSGKLHLQEVSLLARDIARHWIGGVVSIGWWNDSWYSWALSEYLAILAVDKALPKDNFLEKRFYSRLEAIYNMDKEEKLLFIKKDADPKDFIYDSGYINMVLQKGPVLMRMVHMAFGDQVFQKGLRKFFKDFRGRSADLYDLWNCLTEVAHNNMVLPGVITVEKIMQGWTTQTGLPLVTVTRHYINQKITFTQTRFTKNNDQNNAQSQSCWWVPINYFTSSKTVVRSELWLSCIRQEITVNSMVLNGDWIIFNNKVTGLYRVNYDPENWKMIAKALDTAGNSGINVMNRAQLVSDALDFAKIGHLDYQTALTIALYLRHEKSYLPWKAAFIRFKDINENLVRSAQYTYFKRFLYRLMLSLYNTFTDYPSLSDELEKVQKDVFKWPCQFDVQGCVNSAVKEFNEYKDWRKLNNDKDNPLPKFKRRVVYCQGVRLGNAEDWELLHKDFYRCQDFKERKDILCALSCTSSTSTLNRYLEWSINKDSPIPSELRSYVFRKVSAKEAGYTVARDFLFKNVERMKGFLPEYDIVRMHLQVLADKVVSFEELKQLADFANKNHQMILSKSALQESFNLATQKLSWLDKISVALITLTNLL